MKKHKKKIIFLILLLIALGLYFFLGNGKQKVSNFFTGADFGSFFDATPQSQNDLVTEPDVATSTDSIPTETKYVAPVLRQISFEPIAGYTSYATTSTSTREVVQRAGTSTVETTSTEEYLATTTAIRFQERATGHIYDVFEFALAPVKISNTTIQKVYNAIFSSNKDSFLDQTLAFNNEQIKTTFNKLITSTSTDPTLAQNDISAIVNDFTYNKKANNLIFSIKQDGVSNIYTSNFDKTAQKLIATLYFNDFLIDPINATEVLITTKASQTALGYSYVLNTTTGILTKILGDVPGLLVKVSPDKKYYIYSQSESSRPSFHFYNTTTKLFSLISIDTLPEKCVFSQKNSDDLYCFGSLIYKTGQYPDDWYKGKIFNIESLYKINLATNSVSILYNFESDKLTFDVINPQLTFNDNFIVFENKYDLTLWSIDLNKAVNQGF
jgi:hypothetical protein